MRECQDCHQEIPTKRLEAVPHTKYCVKCAKKHPEPRPVGFMDWEHKTAPTIVILDPRDKETVRRARMFSERKMHEEADEEQTILDAISHY
jgi:hypothetical protein